eukprot:TRINITY_DN30704_c0_g1_i1.p1 TRINITY_DN30704_c0_g1~~TRINITY_DN30704_c0_g1_i1.p1  ORF type:complete len:192 (-),score=55.99 TRINITY_DN30704_c0_g1_i1:37-612(-)
MASHELFDADTDERVQLKGIYDVDMRPMYTSGFQDVLKELSQELKEPFVTLGGVSLSNGNAFVLFGAFLLIMAFVVMLFGRDSGKEPKCVNARHILLHDEEDCRAARQRIDRGEAFEKVANALSKCPSSQMGGDLGTFGPGKLHKSFDRICFHPETPVGEVIGPVRTPFGWHLFFIDARFGMGDDEDKKTK